MQTKTKNENTFDSLFQWILNFTNGLVITAIQKTSLSKRLSDEERESFSRELTASFFSMTLGRFTKNKSL